MDRTYAMQYTPSACRIVSISCRRAATCAPISARSLGSGVISCTLRLRPSWACRRRSASTCLRLAAPNRSSIGASSGSRLSSCCTTADSPAETPTCSPSVSRSHWRSSLNPQKMKATVRPTPPNPMPTAKANVNSPWLRLTTLLNAMCRAIAAAQPSSSDAIRLKPRPKRSRPSATPTNALALPCINEVEKARLRATNSPASLPVRLR